jgi:hypothetical protein
MMATEMLAAIRPYSIAVLWRDIEPRSAPRYFRRSRSGSLAKFAAIFPASSLRRSICLRQGKCGVRPETRHWPDMAYSDPVP